MCTRHKVLQKAMHNDIHVKNWEILKKSRFLKNRKIWEKMKFLKKNLKLNFFETFENYENFGNFEKN